MSRRWAVVDLVLLCLALVLLGVLLVVRPGTGGPELAPAARAASAQQREATRAAGTEVLAFLQVDHRDMDAVVERVLAAATGDFREEYAAGRVELVRSVERRSATVEASLRAVGLAEVDGDRAVATVAADSVLVDDRTGADGRLRKHRLRVELVKQDDRWLVSALEFV